MWVSKKLKFIETLVLLTMVTLSFKPYFNWQSLAQTSRQECQLQKFKTVTTVLALDTLGDETQIETILYAQYHPRWQRQVHSQRFLPTNWQCTQSHELNN